MAKHSVSMASMTHNSPKEDNKLKNLEKENKHLLDILLSGKGPLWRFMKFEEPNPKIMIVSITGKKISIPVSDSMTIEDIKKAMEDKTNLPFYMQRLIFAGHQLSNHRTLIHYNITNGSIIHLVLNRENSKTWKQLSFNQDERRDIAADYFEYQELQKQVRHRKIYAARYPNAKKY